MADFKNEEPTASKAVADEGSNKFDPRRDERPMTEKELKELHREHPGARAVTFDDWE